MEERDMAKSMQMRDKGGVHVDGKTVRRAATDPGWTLVEKKSHRQDKAKVEGNHTVDHHVNQNALKVARYTKRPAMARQNRKVHVMHAETSEGPAWEGKGKLAGHVGRYHNDHDNK